MFAFLTKSWAAYQRQLSLLLPLAVMYALAYIGSNALPPLLLPKTAHKFWYFAVAGLVLFWEAWWNAGLIYFLAAALNEQKPKFVSFFKVPSGALGGLFVLNLLRIFFMVLAAVPVLFFNTHRIARILPLLLIVVGIVFVIWYNVRFSLAAARVVV